MSDHYSTLGVDASANFTDIRAAHRAMMRKIHPDVAGPKPASTTRAAEVNEAWAVLKDPQRRAAYDRARSRVQSEESRKGASAARAQAGSNTPGIPSWGPGGIRPITVQQLREAATREQAYSEIGRQQRAAFSAASRRIGIRIVGACAVLLATVVALVTATT